MSATSMPAFAGGRPDLGAARARIAGQYAELLDTLVRAAPPPEGFDPYRLKIQADRLAARRRRHQH